MVTEESTPPPDDEPMVNARLIVHTSSREEFRLDLGQMKPSQRDTLNQLVANAFLIGPTKDWSIRDASGKDWHFNSDHVVLAVVELQ